MWIYKFMTPLFTQEEFDVARADHKLMCRCEHCGEPYGVEKRWVTRKYKTGKDKVKFCGNRCRGLHRSKDRRRVVVCLHCGKEFTKGIAAIKKYPNHFCCRSCSVTYHNLHKSIGNRRSKLETWIGERLTTRYENIEFHFNKKETIGSELDIFVPTICVAFEISGIHHYNPIYGNKKLFQIQKNDEHKKKSCTNIGIELIVIDVSKYRHFSPKTAEIYLDFISTIIEKRLGNISLGSTTCDVPLSL